MDENKKIDIKVDELEKEVLAGVFDGIRKGFRMGPRFFRICDPQIIMITESINRLKTFIKIRDELEKKYPGKSAEEVIEELIKRRQELKDKDESLII